MRGRGRRGSAGSHGRKVHWRAVTIAVGLVIAASFLTAVFLARGMAVARLRAETAVLRTEARQEAIRQEALREQLASAGDPQVIEDRARERLGLIMPGEEKVVFVEE